MSRNQPRAGFPNVATSLQDLSLDLGDLGDEEAHFIAIQARHPCIAVDGAGWPFLPPKSTRKSFSPSRRATIRPSLVSRRSAMAGIAQSSFRKYPSTARSFGPRTTANTFLLQPWQICSGSRIVVSSMTNLLVLATKLLLPMPTVNSPSRSPSLHRRPEHPPPVHPQLRNLTRRYQSRQEVFEGVGGKADEPAKTVPGNARRAGLGNQ